MTRHQQASPASPATLSLPPNSTLLGKGYTSVLLNPYNQYRSSHRRSPAPPENSRTTPQLQKSPNSSTRYPSLSLDNNNSLALTSSHRYYHHSSKVQLRSNCSKKLTKTANCRKRCGSDSYRRKLQSSSTSGSHNKLKRDSSKPRTKRPGSKPRLSMK